MSSKNRWAPLKKALDEINRDVTQQSEWDAHLIIPGLFLGNERSSRNLNWLNENKIQVIITVNLDNRNEALLRPIMDSKNSS